MDIHGLIDRLRREGPSSSPPIPMDEAAPMSFESWFAEGGAGREELEAVPYQLPSDLRDFWAAARTARLFEDRTYGQWGLVLLSPTRALGRTVGYCANRRRDFAAGDLVVGEFLGDSDLLVIRCDPTMEDFGAVLIASPLDGRPDWPHLASSLGEFLDRYVRSVGDKFWPG